jgi:hypothetical protein
VGKAGGYDWSVEVINLLNGIYLQTLTSNCRRLLLERGGNTQVSGNIYRTCENTFNCYGKT